MAVLEALTEDECALYAILTDESGIDLAEFALRDESSPDGLFRAWCYQWPWWRDQNKLSVDCCGRSVGKTKGIQLSAFVFPFARPGQEMLITAPELVHLQPLTQAIENMVLSVRLSRELLDRRNRGTGFTHQPFAAQFSNGSRILGRIPQRDGRGVKGAHPNVLHLEEGQNYPSPGWVELFETLRFGREDAYWRAHGVTTGQRNDFYKISQPGSGWKVFTVTGMHKPDWSNEEREQKDKMYGGRQSPDYKRNIYGAHGDHTNPLFVLSRLAICYDMNELSDYNINQYVKESITAEKMEEHNLPIEEFVKVPGSHYKYDRVWIGADLGWTSHPTEILVFAEEPKEKKGMRVEREVSQQVLKLVSRWHLERISAPDQRRMFRKLFSIYRPKAISLDATGAGLPLYQELLVEDPAIARTIKGYNFSSKIPVDFEDAENVKDSLIMRRVLEFSSDKLREYVDSGWLKFPRDIPLFREFQGQSYCCDEETEVLTKRGWLTYDQVLVGDEVLGFESDSGKAVSKWTAVTAVNTFDVQNYEMLKMDGQCHNSLTTLNHRWLVKPFHHAKYHSWQTSLDLLDDKRWGIPLTAVRTDVPLSKKYDDDFVQLVAWYYTEGHIIPGDKIGVAQSPWVNPDKCAQIERVLVNLLGDGVFDPGQGNKRGSWGWSCTSAKGREHCNNYRVLNRELSARVMDVAPGATKVVTTEFLSNLTQDQLDLFIQTSLDADGCVFSRIREGRRATLVRGFTQNHEGRAKSFEIACALRGIATHTSYDPQIGRYSVSVLRRRQCHNISANREIVSYTGKIWCPTTGTGTWLARRRGAVFFTGNSVTKTEQDPYGRRTYSKGSFHALDAARMAICGHALYNLEALLAEEEPGTDDVLDIFYT